MNYRRTEILAETNLVGAATLPIEILIKEPISRIGLKWRVVKTLAGMIEAPHADIVRIELLDGSDVLHSTDGGQNQAVCIYDRKTPTMNHGQHLVANSEFSAYGIDFGRYLYDPMLALLPTRFNNLQLRVTYDSNNCDAGAASGNLEVYADVFDEKVISPLGFLMTKEHHRRVPPAAGFWYVDLPTDYPIRKMFIQGRTINREPWWNVINCRLDEENEKRIPLNVQMFDYYMQNKGVWQAVEENFVGICGVAAVQFYVTPTDFFAAPLTAAMGGGVNAMWFPNFQPGGSMLITGVAGQQFGGLVHGWLPNHTFEFPFGKPDDLDDWYDVAKLTSLRLRLNAGAGGAAGTVAAILQQFRRY